MNETALCDCTDAYQRWGTRCVATVVIRALVRHRFNERRISIIAGRTMQRSTLAPPVAPGALASGSPTSVPLAPGRGLVHWVRLTQQRGTDMAGVEGAPCRKVEPSDMHRHDKADDCWIVLHGSVYNATAYLQYHPGGVEELMRAAGADGTELFNAVHPWVNYKSMLHTCLVGTYVGSSRSLRRPSEQSAVSNRGGAKRASTSGGLGMRPKARVVSSRDRVVELEVPKNVAAVSPERVCCYSNSVDGGSKLRLVSRPAGSKRTDVLCFEAGVNLDVDSPLLAVMTSESGRTCVRMRVKDNAEESCTKLEATFAQIPYARQFHRFTVSSLRWDTRDTMHLGVCSQAHGSTLWMPVPPGHHVMMCFDESDKFLCRAFTPVPGDFPNVATDEPKEPSYSQLHFLIKVYNDGRFTSRLKSAKIDDALYISDPVGDFDERSVRRCGRLCLLAAGTGLTPMLRIVLYSAGRRADVRAPPLLVCFNKTAESIIWREKLEMAAQNGLLQVQHVLSAERAEPPLLHGTVSPELLRRHVLTGDYAPPMRRGDDLVCVCGPDAFVHAALSALRSLDVDTGAVHIFQG